ncbi:hypothetical protein CUMW_270800 [Citrus unshiu]|uniref:O-methyltransferase domain-containing protein n=1 Tax=Citrus unshiu TaxID=55188 RepID=A0A2H5QXF0_CITUN|nr:hypothetical protein CUMW_270800 [Citrus unshiu]
MCATYLKNCYDALQNSGRSVVVDSLITRAPLQTDILSTVFLICLDMQMYTVFPGGKGEDSRGVEGSWRTKAGFTAV